MECRTGDELPSGNNGSLHTWDLGLFAAWMLLSVRIRM